MANSLNAYMPHTKRQYWLWSAIALVLVYLLGSRALDTGSLGQYGLTLLLFYFCVQFLVQGIRLNTDGKRR